ncbi:hypothetical protein C0Q70_00924 [Pomacea canaliculata]|uniref:Uncharacterized protein n=1 Tax=Pomacea canaliculata TaxID=400727 RepID=A0A2T7PY02_POMCA|nr:uncharacterized protein LOC112567412 isoform X1 [Pomacea canaliculata]XP_025099885.1 uncharacterized protein LOC112567412 isoform X1 [Pomacea canaliculata]PVD38312.1 hypothetical protein C0Q70_00924 [Pomacea canaliculata]
MATFQLRLLMRLMVLCSMVVLANGGVRGGSYKTSYNFGSSSSGDSSSSLTPAEGIGLGCGIIGAIIIIFVSCFFVYWCNKKIPSKIVKGVIISYDCEDTVTGLPPTDNDAVSDPPENSTVTTPQPDPPSEPTEQDNPYQNC